MERRTVVCLANSRKLGDYCVAGIDPTTGEWIRPQGSGDHGAVTEAEQLLEDGSRPELLQRIDIPLLHAAPTPAQPENWQLADGTWRGRGRLDDREVRDLMEGMVTDEPVFGTNERSISVAEAEASPVESSLAVIRPEELVWSKEVRFGKVKLRAQFRHAGSWHDLGVTDLAWIEEFADDELGRYEHPATEDVFLVISLAEPLEGEHYKLVAGVISLEKEV